MNISKFSSRECVFLDGAMGTLLRYYGISDYDYIPYCNIERPEIVSKVHEAYVEAGCDIILTNSFRINDKSIKQDKYSMEDMIISSVTIAKRASKGRSIAYDIGPLGLNIGEKGDISSKEAFRSFMNISKVIKYLPIDIIFIETMYDLKEAVIAVEAFKDLHIPIFCSFTFNELGKIYSGEDVNTILKSMESMDIQAIGLNCSMEPEKCCNIVKSFSNNTELPIIAKPNLGSPKVYNKELHYGIDGNRFAKAMYDLKKAGAFYIGGCCGTTPSHIKAMIELIKS